MGRDTPFAPWDGIIKDEKKKGKGGEGKEIKKKEEQLEIPKGTVAGTKDDDPTISILDGSSPVAYMGVWDMCGKRYGMLRVKDGRFRNVQEGDKLTDFGCTIVRVEQQAIHLLTREGVYHILRKNGS
jgi:hypothetical protein